MYFQANPAWTVGAKKSVRYAISFARRYSEQGDHEVSAAALDAIISINEAYIEAKGRTFYGQHLLGDNSLSTDDFINDTLEHLRQNGRIALTRADEQQIEQTFQTLAALVRLYSTIDYGREHTSKTHAHLAAGYLAPQVEQTLPHKMADVLMEGLRIMGDCAAVLRVNDGPDATTTLANKISAISAVAVQHPDYRPVTATGVGQLARLSADLLGTRSRDIRHAVREVRSGVSSIVTRVLELPDSPFAKLHDGCLAPYYSSTSDTSLPAHLTRLTNALADRPEGDSDAIQLLHNIEQWADGLYQTEKQVLIDTVAKRSSFAFDIIHWVSTVTSVLMACSNAAACSSHLRARLRQHATWLFSTFSFIPHDLETVTFLENFRMTDILFDAVLDARRRDGGEVTHRIRKVFLSWALAAGRHNTGWATLERSICGLATLAVQSSEASSESATLKAEIVVAIGANAFPDFEIREHFAEQIRERADDLPNGSDFGSIEQAMLTVDPQQLRALLLELAGILAPQSSEPAPDHVM
jgi:hypothetical protein